jgi:hypothetical protein
VSSFPPATTRLTDIALLVELFASCVGAKDALYVSSPLTSGWRAFEWHLNGGRNLSPPERLRRFADEVVEPNRREAASFAARLRHSELRVVIDPTAVSDIPGWTQSDYHVFWGDVLARYARTTLFRDGWQFSTGCSYEFFVAHREGTEVLDEKGHPLSRGRGIVLLREAIVRVADHGLSADFLVGVHDALSASSAVGGVT